MAETVEFGFLAGYTDGDGFDHTPDQTNETNADPPEYPPEFRVAGQPSELPEGCGQDEDLDCDFIPVDILRPEPDRVLGEADFEVGDEPF